MGKSWYCQHLGLHYEDLRNWNWLISVFMGSKRTPVFLFPLVLLEHFRLQKCYYGNQEEGEHDLSWEGTWQRVHFTIGCPVGKS